MARILIIEDEMIVARDLEAVLTDMGHSVVGIAIDSTEALQLAEDERPELALVDIGLKGDRDGVSIGAYLKEEFPIRVVFLTSHADDETVKRASSIKPNGYLLKPFTDEGLFAGLSVALSQPTSPYKPIALSAMNASGDAANKLPPSVMQAIADHVARNLDKEISLAALAEIADMSESAFSRRFKATLGLTPYQYVLAERLSEAKRLLRATDWPLTDISDAIGFSSQSHFTTTFKSHIGVTPLAYRRL
jgi:AraC-like DNA-binding protein